MEKAIIIGIMAEIGTLEASKTHAATAARYQGIVDGYPEIATISNIIAEIEKTLKESGIWPLTDKGKELGYNAAAKISKYASGFWATKKYLEAWYSDDKGKLEKRKSGGKGEGEGGKGKGEGGKGKGEGGKGEGEVIPMTADVAIAFLSVQPIIGNVKEDAVRKALQTLRNAFIPAV